MKIKSLIVVDENGKEYAFTHRSLVEVKEYTADADPEVQGTGLAELQVAETTSTPTVPNPEEEPEKPVKRAYKKKKK